MDFLNGHFDFLRRAFDVATHMLKQKKVTTTAPIFRLPESPCFERFSGRIPEWAFSGFRKYRFNPVSFSGSLSDVRFLCPSEKMLELVLNHS
ncbi:MAG: hypothetical protein RQ722_04820 [Desulfuromonadales bacterium]|nr:hypothetical protein [Desulfuromonadales bacterium]